MSVAERLSVVREQIASAARSKGRDPSAVTLIAVSKTQPVESIAAAYDAGQRDFGENYAQELVSKAVALKVSCPEVRWHFIGRPQKNKFNALAPHVFAWHTVEDAAGGEALAKRVSAPRVLVQVNVAREPQKGGVMPEALTGLLAALVIKPVGLMTIPPVQGDPSPHFLALAKLRDTHLPGGWLSMGMSADFAIAIACGATHVRVGTAIFGERTLEK